MLHLPNSWSWITTNLTQIKKYSTLLRSYTTNCAITLVKARVHTVDISQAKTQSCKNIIYEIY